ncbi:MAG: L,D-transpeptidase family protein [Paracoccus sp. (in: a-proteobacteria)]|uniref:L,D-transpeptidase family protein n=1 Tax=Paracoccus sp. TaxID=267 RepID=UPI0026DFA03C|nr:L,D-transpeptidase family protein [Paracoccus sp. (in: a-proteobacteria)]MDO5621786.1 L,D-transpeptidase family protein [Paracoccus sp. (in: a-proteobacteria)]
MRALAATILVAVVASCGAPPSKFKTYDGPPITQVVIEKGKREMYLLSGNQVVKAYQVGLGTNPVGHKQFEGDGKTPEGIYYIDRLNPNSRYHLSLGISYPNPLDRAAAEPYGISAGSDIMIHGRGPEGNVLAKQKRDWTVGCIAVTDKEIEDIFAMVPVGTPVILRP